MRCSPIILPLDLCIMLLMNIANTRIGDWLGLQPPATEGEMLRIVEERLPSSVIKRLISLGFERSEIDSIIIPQRTLQRRRSRREKLTVEESDRAMRTVRVLSLAESVYGNRERVLAWIRKPHARLDGRAPISLLKTYTGSRIVEELLVQIDDGIFV
jgi:putative toxin-antitoxin system antitoxin component (TIGR02293 family)